MVKGKDMIKITHYKPSEEGTRKATFSIQVEKWGGFQIRDMCLFQKGTTRWVSYPARSYEAEGKKKYFSFNGFADLNMDKAFKERILYALDEFISTTNTLEKQIVDAVNMRDQMIKERGGDDQKGFRKPHIDLANSQIPF